MSSERLTAGQSQRESATAVVNENIHEINDYRLQIKVLEGHVEVLIATVAKQSESITKLSSQLNYVLSFLDIQENGGSNHQADLGGPIERRVEDSLVQFQRRATANGTTCSIGASMHQQLKSFADVIRQSVRVVLVDNKNLYEHSNCHVC